ncbi:MAG TPA: kelch repeat-containing protein [Planctomycetota bacterium]|nr:kelch repeat-containing protein [Planctomycetota bacterium]
MRRAALLLAFPLLAPPALAQATLASTGDAIGGTATFTYAAGIPLVTCALLPSTILGPNPILVALTGDAGDLLGVGNDFLFQGIFFFSPTGASGSTSFALPIPNDPGLVGAAVYFQALEFDPIAPAPIGTFKAFSNVRAVTVNAPGAWQPALSDLGTTRALHTANRLDDGRVLVAGGGPVTLADPYGAVASAEIFDPALESHAPTLAPMSSARAFHAAAKLADGRVLLAGGVDGGFESPPGSGNFITNVLPTAEIFNPATGLFSPTGSMAVPRAGHAATLLPDGRVLVTGGTKGNASFQVDTIIDILNNALSSAEVYDPATGLFSPVAGMSQSKVGHASVLLDDGDVLVASGVAVTIVIGIPVPSFSTVCQRFDPATNAFSAVGSLPAGTGRALFPAVKLGNGKVLVAGGTGNTPLNIQPIADARLFNPATDLWEFAPPLAQARGTAAATRLLDGRVLVSGGATGAITAPVPIASCEIYDPATGSWASTGSLLDPRGTHVAVLLPDGTVYVSGGGGLPSGQAIASAETYTP